MEIHTSKNYKITFLGGSRIIYPRIHKSVRLLAVWLVLDNLLIFVNTFEKYMYLSLQCKQSHACSFKKYKQKTFSINQII